MLVYQAAIIPSYREAQAYVSNTEDEQACNVLHFVFDNLVCCVPVLTRPFVDFFIANRGTIQIFCVPDYDWMLFGGHYSFL